MAIALAIRVPTEEAKMSKAATAAASGALGRDVNRLRQGNLRVLPGLVSSQHSAERVAAELDRAGTTVACRKGKTLVEEGDPAEYIFKVVSGAIRAVRLLADGRRYVASFHMPGDFLGLADGESYSHSFEALADASLIRYTRTSFEAMLDRNPGAGRSFFGILRKELSAAQDRLLLLGRKTAAERLASFLLSLADRNSGNNDAGDGAIELPMNRSDMADYLGLRIETVCRLLTDLKHRRIIDLPGIHSVMVLRRDLLETESEGTA